MIRSGSFALRLLLLGAALSLPAAASAQEGRGPPPRPQQQAQPQQQHQAEQRPEQRQSGPGVLRLLPGDSVTEHSIDLAGGKKLTYTATAGTLALYDQSGEQSAAVFYTAYVAKDAGE